MKTFYISDTHFFHQKIIMHCNRPYRNSNQMNRDLRARWNRVVGQDDLVIHGGDFAWKHSIENTLELLRKSDIVRKLNGRKILVKGNHDPDASDMLKLGFDDVVPYWQQDGILVYHYPGAYGHKEAEKNFPSAAYLAADVFLYGHVHNNPHTTPDKGINISAELVGYTPRTLEELLARRT